MGCIYKIVNKINNKFYIGSSHKSLLKRKAEHITSLKNQYHDNKHLQSAWNKYGISNFEFIEIENYVFPKDYSKEFINEYIGSREIYWITLLNPDYNICKEYNRGTLGRVKTIEERNKISNSKIGKKRTDRSWLGRNHTIESKEKMRLSKLGKKRKPHSEETKFKMRQSYQNRIKQQEV